MEATNLHTTITFVHQRSPLAQQLTVLGELKDDAGKRIWAAWGVTESDVLRKATAWWDNCNGRAGHTPLIDVDLTWPLSTVGAVVIQHAVQKRQAANMGQRAA